MKKVIMGIALALSLTGLGYSGFSIYVAAKENLEKNSLNRQIKELNDKKVKTEASLKDVTEKNIKLKKEYNQLRQQRGIKVVYLTFDDGPTPNNTPKILDILKKNNIKGTFFVIGQNPDLYKRIVDEGHAIAIHTYSHEYKQVYASVDAFFADLYKLRDLITTRVSKPLKQAIINRLTKEGYVYQDWNCDSTDASGNKVPVEKLVKNGVCNVREVNLLMHDAYAKTTTVEALQQIIDAYKAKGYIFEVLTVDSPKFQHVKQPDMVD